MSKPVNLYQRLRDNDVVTPITEAGPDIFVHPRETWDEKQCAAAAKHRGKDGCGTKHPYPGLVAGSGSGYATLGSVKEYNGGCVRGDKHYRGELYPLPVIPDSYEFFYRLSWGTYIRKKTT